MISHDTPPEVEPKERRGWRRGLDPGERRRVVGAVALRYEGGWLFRFSVMLGLSIVVAVMGLSAGSAAVVIGAMLLAPLMTPVMGTAAALAMALPRHLGRSLIVVLVASAAGVVLAYLLSALLPDIPLSNEILARTRPDLRDLIVALAAGAAGAYATIRPDVSSSLPGVAVAVALVPPLATIGMTLQDGRGDLVGGAVLLYSANLVAIVLVATLVFIATGFVPPRRLEGKSKQVLSAGVVLSMATIGIAVPLAVATLAAAEDGRVRERLHTAAEAWIGGTGDDLDAVRAEGSVVRVAISGPSSPPDVADLERAVADILGRDADVEVRWTQTREPSTATETSAAVAKERLRKVVATWFETTGSSAFDIERLDEFDDEIRVDLVSAQPPPSVDQLAARIESQLGIKKPVVVNWTRRTALRASEDQTAAATERKLRVLAQDWIELRDGYQLDELRYDGEVVHIELLGPAPLDVTELEAQIRTVAPADTPIEVWLTRRERLGPA